MFSVSGPLYLPHSLQIVACVACVACVAWFCTFDLHTISYFYYDLGGDISALHQQIFFYSSNLAMGLVNDELRFASAGRDLYD